MNAKGLILSAAALLMLVSCRNDYTRLVNPLVGTAGHGHTTPAAIVPFGMVQPGPDTRLDGWDGCSGYHYSDDTLYGFSQTHLSGTGCLDLGDVLLMPVTEVNLASGIPWGDSLRDCYLSTFRHRDEVAEPGYYGVMLRRNKVRVQLTATDRCALHRYSFPHHGTKGVVIDLRHRDVTLSAGMHMAQDEQGRPLVTGWRESSSWNPDQKLFFALGSDTPIERVEYAPDSSQAVLFFPDDTRRVAFYVSLSSVDEAGARRNLAVSYGTPFEAVRESADSLWRMELGRIDVGGATRTDRRNFYTALYHCMTSPYLYSDVDGRYRGMDDSIYVAEPGHPSYTVFSLWDTYRALHPLLTLIDHPRTEDFVRTMLRQFEQGGELTMWELWGHETHCMIGYHAAPVILEAFRAGVLDDWSESARKAGQPDPLDRLLLAMMVTSNRTEAHREYAQNGYMDASVDNESVSKTLEYAYDDWCIAQFAQMMLDRRDSLHDYANLTWRDSTYTILYEDVFHSYMQRSQSWRNLMDADGFMHARRNGGFVTPFDPTEVNNHYTEANCWQYSSYVPHDVAGWMQAHGGAKQTERFLDSLFFGSSEMTGRDQSDITGLIGQYAHGNEPSHHAAFLYAFLDRADKTDQLVHRILKEFYTPKPDGLCGNEDCGQMSAWYVLSACGLYPVCPGSGEFVTCTPLFSSVKLRRWCPEPYDHTLTIRKNEWLPGRFFHPGNWRRQTNDAFSAKSVVAFPDTLRLTPAPYFGDWQQQADSNARVSLACPDKKATILYTLDGSVPTLENGARYEAPFAVTGDMLVRAVAYNPTTGYSRVVRQQRVRFVADRTLTYVTRPEPQYTESGEMGLVDRVYGTENYRIGGWQGWMGDMVVVVDLLEPRHISHVGVDCLDNMKSWIFFPSKVVVSVSDDGQTYRPFGEVVNDLFAVSHAREEESVKHLFSVAGAADCRYVKVQAVNYGKLPSWHVSAGEQAWLFADEVVIE